MIDPCWMRPSHDLLDGREELVTGDRLSQVGDDARRDVARFGFRRVIGGIHNGRDVQSCVHEMPSHLESAHVRHVGIEQNAIRRSCAFGERVEKLAAGRIDARTQPERHAKTAQAGANGFFVVYDHDKH